MFAGFNINIDLDLFKKNFLGLNTEKEFNEYKDIGKKHLESKKINCNKELSNYIVKGIIDGTRVENNWFPQIKADIFISHSHKDENLALALAGWLNKNFGLECFIDSCVWGYMDELLKQINNEYSDKKEQPNGGIVYDYGKCNKAACHVNMMLNIALQKMIDNAEAVFLINTPNSIEKYSETYESSTFSPWIYSEITCTQIIRMKQLLEYRKKNEEIKHFKEGYFDMSNEIQAEYKVSLDHLSKLEYAHLITWKDKWSKITKKYNKYALDELYKITHPKEVKKLIELERNSVA